jgi:hypothetical protein
VERAFCEVGVKQFIIASIKTPSLLSFDTFHPGTKQPNIALNIAATSAKPNTQQAIDLLEIFLLLLLEKKTACFFIHSVRGTAYNWRKCQQCSGGL